MLYDTETSISRQIAHAALIGQPHFRSDGKAALFIAYDAFGPKPVMVLREATLDGKTRVLRDISEVAQRPVEVIADSIIYDRSQANVRFISGPEHQIFDVATIPPAGAAAGPNNSPYFPSLSPDGRWLARKSIDGRAIDVVALDGSTRRRIPVPYSMHDRLGVKFHPNGREVIIPVKTTADSPGGFAAIPLDGGAPRRIITLRGNEAVSTYSLSADGSTILYTTRGLPRVTLVDVDFSPGLQH
jgi:hypothetical protein